MSLETSSAASPIENELPTYRAISPLAVTSLLFGLASVFTFADHWFALFGAAAVVSGVLALRRITRFPDMLTGAAFARAGVLLGLCFTLAAITFGVVRNVAVKRDAEAFARAYGKLLATRDVANCAFFHQVPEQRYGLTAQKAMDEIKKNSDQMTKANYAEGIEDINRSLEKAGKDASIEFSHLEAYGYDGVTPYAAAVYKIHGADDAGKIADRLALFELYTVAEYDAKRDTAAIKAPWYYRDVTFPYESRTFKPKVKPVDDGHGHNE